MPTGIGKPSTETTSKPPDISTLPLGSVSRPGASRRTLMLAAPLHAPLAGLQISVLLCACASACTGSENVVVPPTTSTRPSGSSVAE